jgi:transcription antitermination factor NusG
MAYWAAARLHRERLGLHCLEHIAGFEVYAPRICSHRVVNGRRITFTPLLFPPYVFVWIELQWHAAAYAPGVASLVRNGDGGPAHVPPALIDALRARERNGLIVLPKPRGPRVGSRVKVTIGPFAGQLGIYAGMKPHQRVEVLLTLLGGQQRVSLSREAIEPG